MYIQTMGSITGWRPRANASQSVKYKHNLPLFKGKPEREKFFAEIEANPNGIKYGTAIRHARSAYLGRFANKKYLMADCALMLAYEIMKHENKLFKNTAKCEKNPKKKILTNSSNSALELAHFVINSASFHEMFSKARNIVEQACTNGHEIVESMPRPKQLIAAVMAETAAIKTTYATSCLPIALELMPEDTAQTPNFGRSGCVLGAITLG